MATQGSKGKVGIYVRVSDVKGRKGDQYVSPEEQVRKATEYAADLGYTAVEVQPYDENVKHSWPLEDRPLMLKLVAMCAAGKLQGIVVSSLDRLGGAGFMEILKAQLHAAGAVLLVKDAPTAGVNTKGYAAMPEYVMTGQHTFHRQEIGLRWHGQRQLVVAKGIHPAGICPIGYRRHGMILAAREGGGRDQWIKDPAVGEPRVADFASRQMMAPDERWADPLRRQLVPDERWADVVRGLYRLRKAQRPWPECVRYLDGSGAPNAKGVSGPGAWSSASVYGIITNPVYKGWASLMSKGKQDGHIINEMAHEPLVDAGTWQRAQPKKGVGKRSSEAALLSKLLLCGECGRTLTPSYSGGVHGKRTYSCRPTMVQRDRGPCVCRASVPTAEVEQLVVESFLAWVAWTPKPEAAPQFGDLQRAVDQAAGMVAHWKQQCIDADTPATADAARASLAQWETRHTEAGATLTEAQDAAGVVAGMASIPARWEGMSTAERNQTLRDFGTVVLVHGHGVAGRKDTEAVVRGRVTVVFSTLAETWNTEGYEHPADAVFTPEVLAGYEQPDVVAA